MGKICVHCQKPFGVTDKENQLREKCSPVFNGKKYLFPEPDHCPDCRYWRHLCYRNERSLYHRKCDLTGKQMISIFSADKLYKVYSQEEWWGDNWSPLEYGRDFDFSRSFFDQFHELRLDVPRIAITNHNSENSEYTNQSENNKNCYMLTSSGMSEDCLYGHWIQRGSKWCVDNLLIRECELCYECVNTVKCYDCNWLENAQNCSGCSFGYDLIGCRDCLGCVGLSNKQYYVLNKEVGKVEFEKIQKMVVSSRRAQEEFIRRFNELKAQFPRKYYSGKMIENSTGDYIQQAKDSFECFNCQDVEDVMYSRDAWLAKDCMDMTETLDDELCYELHGSAFNRSTCFTSQTWQSSDSYYCDLVFEVKNCFGCVGLKHQQYCIFNKQYSREEYEVLVPKIIEHMMRTQYSYSLPPPSDQSSSTSDLSPPYQGKGNVSVEWGQFFPPQHGMYGYNETTAQEYFPLTKEEVLAKGLKWFEREEQVAYQGAQYEVPDSIEGIEDDVCDKVLICSVSGRPYKVIKQELKFYKQKGLPLPIRCPDQRHHERMMRRNPRHLWSRECSECGKGIESSYSPEREERVLCEECYLKQLY